MSADQFRASYTAHLFQHPSVSVDCPHDIITIIKVLNATATPLIWPLIAIEAYFPSPYIRQTCSRMFVRALGLLGSESAGSPRLNVLALTYLLPFSLSWSISARLTTLGTMLSRQHPLFNSLLSASWATDAWRFAILSKDQYSSSTARRQEAHWRAGARLTQASVAIVKG